MNKRNHKTYCRDKQNLEKRLERKHYEDQPKPMFKDSNIVYEIAERTRAIACGGIGAFHKLVCRLKVSGKPGASTFANEVSICWVHGNQEKYPATT